MSSDVQVSTAAIRRDDEVHSSALGDYRPVGQGRSWLSFLYSLCSHSLLVLLLLMVRVASEAPKPSEPRRNLIFSELAPAPRPQAVRRVSAIPKLALPAEAPVRSALALPHLAQPRPARPAALPEAPPLARPELVRITLPEVTSAVARPMTRPRPDVSLGSFAEPVTDKTPPLARVPAVTGSFAGAANIAAKPAPGAIATAGFGEAVTSRGQRRDIETTARAGFGDAVVGKASRTGGAGTAGPGGFRDAVAGKASRPGGAGTAGPGGFGDAVARAVPAESRQVRAVEFQTAVAIETPKPAGNAAAEEGTESAIAILDKPRPAYTEEARQLKIEGEVWLEVAFSASGKAHVLRVLKGLGHGLDESATRSAEAIRFRPAMRRGMPVDATAVARISFQLAY